jgi:hypothetical protein
MEDPLLRASTGRGERWDDPSIDMLFELISDLERGDEEFFIVEQLDGSAANWFRVTRVVSGEYLMERNERSMLMSATTRNKRWVHAAVVDWAHGISNSAHEVHGWEEGLNWQPRQSVPSSKRRRWFHRP